MEPLSVTLYSDFICPYCFIGEQVLSRVAERYPLKIEWIGYEIHPELPQAGAAAGVLGEMFSESLIERVGPLAARLGVEMHAPAYLPNTHLALEAAEFAREHGRLDEFRDLVFDAFFRKGMNIGGHDVLCALADRAGLDPDAFSEALDERRYFDVIEDHREQAMENLVTGVPTFIIEGARIVGAQSEDVFESAIERLLARRGEGRPE